MWSASGCLTKPTEYLVLAETARYIGCGFADCSSNSIAVVCHIYYSTNTFNLALGPNAFVPYQASGPGNVWCTDCPFDRNQCDLSEGLCRNCSSLNYEACLVTLLYAYCHIHRR